MNRFASKRNLVYRHENRVFKTVSDEAAAGREAGFLLFLRQGSVAVPGGIELRGKVIVMDYVDAVPLPDLLSSPDFPAQQVACGMVNWLSDFYRAVRHGQTGEIRGDVNGRNFLFREDSVWGVDFEEHAFGPMERDIGRLLAFVETYTVPDPSKLTKLHDALLDCALERLALKRALVLEEKELELSAMRVRRKK